MTAAVARPPLFGHLVASRPDRENNSVTATALSVAFHAVLIVTVVLVTARVAVPPAAEATTPIIVNQIATPQLDAKTPPDGGVSNSPIPRPDLPPIEFSLPSDVVPKTIPPPGNYAVPAIPDNYTLPKRTDRSGSGANEGPVTGEQPGDFVPLTVFPRLLNRDEVLRSLQRFYPPILMQAGIGGTALVWLRLDEEGRVIETRIKTGSGHEGLDKAALEVGTRARFSPAYQHELKVKVWVELPVVFNIR